MIHYTTDFVAGKNPVGYAGTIQHIGISRNSDPFEAVNIANKELDDAAADLGGNAILGYRCDIFTYGNDIAAHAYGTVVRF